IALTAVDMNNWGNDNISGHGRLDAYMAVYAALTGIGWIEGVITDELGLPVQTEIYLPDHPHRFTSDEEGHFIFAVPAWLPFEIQVVVPTQEIFSAWLQVDPQDTLTYDIDLIASLNGTLTGTVIDCRGRPAVGAQVEVLNLAVPDDYTDANGRFLFSLPAGFYHLRAFSPECGQTVVNNIQVITAGVTEIEIVLPLNPSFVCSDPDEYGYYVCDSNDPNGPVFDWSGLAPEEGGSGVQFNLYDDGSEEIMLPFSVTFYGETYDRMWINANGNITFGGDLYNYFNTALPLLEVPAVFAFWDDLDDTIDGPGGSIHARYEPENAVFIVEWFQVPRYRPFPEENGRASLEIWIYDSEVIETQSGATVVDVMYGEIDSANTATVGLDAANGSFYLPYVFDGQYETHATPISSGLAIRFTDSDLLNASPSLAIDAGVLELSLDPGEHIDTVITLTNQGAGPLGYRASINEYPFGGDVSSKEEPLLPSGPIQPSDPKGEEYVPPKGYEPVRQPRPSALDEGGPDAFGYCWIDSRDAGGPAYEFTDISAIGEPTGVTGDDMTSETFELPWEFEFYDQRFKEFTINSNGFISFWSIFYGGSNCRLDDDPFRSPFYIIAPFWIDLDPSAGGSITSYYDEADERFIIQWTDIRRFNRPGSESTFQIVLHSNGIIDLVYANVGTNTVYTIIGIKGGHAGNALPIGFGQNYIASGMMLRIYQQESQAAACRILDHSCGSIPPGGSQDIPLRITNSDLFSGSSNWSLIVKSTDPALPYGVVELYMITPGEIDADLTIKKQVDSLVLNWKPFPTSFYCIYSGGPDENELTHFEGMTSDTFFVIPCPEEEARLYEIRLCAAAAGQASE
ncbi:carboxypeptidase-like regulatory domain-containing protein, partial [bacterium]|nr:carboxypeptidase-like regulatory domain-containing protein [bacterium]